MPVITLPDGSTRDYPEPVTGLEIAASIGARLEKDAVALRVDGELVDLSLELREPASVEIVTRTSGAGLEMPRCTR